MNHFELVTVKDTMRCMNCPKFDTRGKVTCPTPCPDEYTKRINFLHPDSAVWRVETLGKIPDFKRDVV